MRDNKDGSPWSMAKSHDFLYRLASQRITLFVRCDRIMRRSLRQAERAGVRDVSPQGARHRVPWLDSRRP